MMTGALLLLACSCLVADVDPVLSEVRALGVKVERMETKMDGMEVKLDAVRDGQVELTAAVKGKNQLIDEDHAALNHPATGLVVRVKDAESSLDRHSRLLWGLLGWVKGVAITVGGAAILAVAGLVIRWVRNGKGKNGNGKRK